MLIYQGVYILYIYRFLKNEVCESELLNPWFPWFSLNICEWARWLCPFKSCGFNFQKLPSKVRYPPILDKANDVFFWAFLQDFWGLLRNMAEQNGTQCSVGDSWYLQRNCFVRALPVTLGQPDGWFHILYIFLAAFLMGIYFPSRLSKWNF